MENDNIVPNTTNVQVLILFAVERQAEVAEKMERNPVEADAAFQARLGAIEAITDLTGKSFAAVALIVDEVHDKIKAMGRKIQD